MLFFRQGGCMFNNKKNESIDFDRLNNLVDNGMEHSNPKANTSPGDKIKCQDVRYNDSIGENKNFNNKKNFRPTSHSAMDNESPNYRTTHYNDSIGRNENHNSKKNYSSNNSRGEARGIPHSRRKSMYVVNLTPTRIGILSGAVCAAILLIFVIGFKIGTSKDKDVVASGNTSHANEDILFRSNASKDMISGAENNSANTANTIVSKNTGYYRNTEPARTDIVPMDLLSDNRASNSHNIATDDINNMINKDLQEMGQSLNNSPSKSVSTKEVLLNSYTDAEPVSYIPGEKNTSTSTFANTSSSSATVSKSVNSGSSQTSENGLVYYIQVAVASTEKSANIERDYLRSKDFVKAYVVDGVAKDGSTMYKLKIGRYATRAQAESALYALKTLSSKYNDSYIYSDKAS